MVTRSLAGLLLLLAPVTSMQTKWLDVSGDPYRKGIWTAMSFQWLF